MNENKYDFVIVNLKVISQVPRNRRLKTTHNGYFTLEDNTPWTAIKRAIYGESRTKLIRDIKSLLAEIQSQNRLLLSSKLIDDSSHQPNPNGNLEKTALLSQIASLHRELERSLTGFENLKSTYSGDILMVGELEHIIDTINGYIHEINKKIPNVAENLPKLKAEETN